MKLVTDPQLLEQLEKSSHLEPVADPKILAELEGETEDYKGFTPIRRVLQGATFGFGDEIQSGIAAATAKAMGAPESLGELYKESQESLKSERKAFSEQNPITSTLLEAGGGMATGGLLGKNIIQQGGKSLLRKGGELGLLGALEGGIYGAGVSEDDRLQGAGKGALVGGIAAPAIGMPLAKVADVAVPMVRNATRKIISTPRSQAEGLISDTVAREGLTPDEIIQAYTRQGDVGTLMDTTIGLKDLGRYARDRGAQAPRIAREVLENRQLGAVDRMIDAAQVATGKSADDYVGIIRKISEQRGAQAGPLYTKAFDESVPSQKMKIMVENRPSLRSAWKKARRIAEDEGLKDVTPFQQYHYTKMALDRQIERAMKTSKTEARALMKIKNKFLNAMDEASPEYKQARDLYAGDSQLLDAANQGQDFMKLKADEIDELFNGFSASEKEMFRHGSIKGIVNNLEEASLTADPSRRLVNKKSMLKKLEHLFNSPADAERFINQAASERSFMESRNRVLQGSMTSTNLLQGPQPTNLVTIARDAAQEFTGNRVTNPEVLDEAMSILLNQGLSQEDIMRLLAQKSASPPTGAIGGAVAPVAASVSQR